MGLVLGLLLAAERILCSSLRRFGVALFGAPFPESSAWRMHAKLGL